MLNLITVGTGPDARLVYFNYYGGRSYEDVLNTELSKDLGFEQNVFTDEWSRLENSREDVVEIFENRWSYIDTLEIKDGALYSMYIDHLFECTRKYEAYKDAKINFPMQSYTKVFEVWVDFLKDEYRKEWIDLFIILKKILDGKKESVYKYPAMSLVENEYSAIVGTYSLLKVSAAKGVSLDFREFEILMDSLVGVMSKPSFASRIKERIDRFKEKAAV